MNKLLTQPTIHISRTVTRSFLRRAWRAYPNEYMEFLWGRREGSQVYVTLATHVRQHATPDSVTISAEDVELEDEAEDIAKLGLVAIGTWHTHPVSKRDPEWLKWMYRSLSVHDHCAGYEAGELVSAVSAMYPVNGRRRSLTKWWVPQGDIKVTYS